MPAELELHRPCPHPVVRQWPALGPWWDWTCARCGQTWRVPWRDEDGGVA